MNKLILATALMSSVAMGKPSMPSVLDKVLNTKRAILFGGLASVTFGGTAVLMSMYTSLESDSGMGGCVFAAGCALLGVARGAHWVSEMKRLNPNERRIVERLRDKKEKADDEVLDSLEPDPHPKGLGGQLP